MTASSFGHLGNLPTRVFLTYDSIMERNFSHYPGFRCFHVAFMAGFSVMSGNYNQVYGSIMTLSWSNEGLFNYFSCWLRHRQAKAGSALEGESPEAIFHGAMLSSFQSMIEIISLACLAHQTKT